jgi:hypothetical protein
MNEWNHQALAICSNGNQIFNITGVRVDSFLNNLSLWEERSFQNNVSPGGRGARPQGACRGPRGAQPPPRGGLPLKSHARVN